MRGCREHVVGEWYNASTELAVDAIKRVAEKIGVVIEYGEEHEKPRASMYDAVRFKLQPKNEHGA